ncbi:S-adenosyl-L-methionine-dependent methyltransferase [Mrakia frigida]|uniref:rRNA (cytosine-C5-)-methyltransferase RCM1 n=1 Tax=Mrakia frigida TaxID=29902 RepID=UPI003FCC18FF
MNLYFQAASFLDELTLQKTSIKALLTSKNLPEKDSKRLLALVIETLKYKPTILELLEKVPLTKDDKKMIYQRSKNLALVLVHDLLFSSKPGIQSSTGPIKEALTKHRARLNAELVRMKIKKGVRSNKELQVGGGVGDQIPRYARINTNLTTAETIIAHLQTPAGGSFTFIPPSSDPYPQPIPPKHFHLDPHLPKTLLVFPLSSSPILTSHASYLSGHLILQDKASCIPAHVLLASLTSPTSTQPLDGEVIDATAAPGNKTTQLSALMGNKGKLHAFELSPGRWKTLRKMVEKAGCSNIDYGKEGGRNFLDTAPKGREWEGVKYILLDPSCSGSGIVNRLDFLMDDPEEENEEIKKDRLQNLGAFQLSMIKHAMKFTSAVKIVYSTCSIHAEEDELVVLAALESAEAKTGGWKLAGREEVLPTWERRGTKEVMGKKASLSEGVLRCEPGTDKTNGFFVSCFTRSSPANDLIVASKKAAKPVVVAQTPSASLPSPSTEVNPASKKSKANKKRKAAAAPAPVATNVEVGASKVEEVGVAAVAKKAKVEVVQEPKEVKEATAVTTLDGWKGETGGEVEGAGSKKKKKRGAKKKGGAGAAVAAGGEGE